jgi:purine catabolism regulator
VGEVRGVVLAIAAARDTSTEVERLVLSQTANAVELVLGHAVPYAAGTRERWNRESLVADLVLGRLASREAADARARLVGLDPGQPARVALFASRTPGAALLARSFVADQRGQAAASIGDTEYVVIVTGEAALAGEPRELASALRSARAQGTDVVLGISELVASPSQAHVALEQARILARLAIGGTLREPLLRVDDVGQTGVHGLLLSLSTGANGDSRGVQRRLGTFAATLLAPLDEHDERRGSELVPTLDAYLDLGGALAQAADRLRIHRNTLSYRLGRIAELTGRDLADPGTRLLFQIALAVRALERVTRDE